MAEIIIGGDICPINRNLPLFIDGDAAALFGDLLPLFEKADLAIVNLECPLIDKEQPVSKSGSILGAPLGAVNGLRNAHVSVASLANNHILDHGAQGLRSTVKACREAGIAIVGAGENLLESAEMLIKEVAGIRLGVLAYAEHEFSIAGHDCPGANPLGLASFIRAVRRRKGEYDYLLVLVHGGTEHYPYPSPTLQDSCRFMIEEGANAVICQHSHCPGCFEEYCGCQIVYGQGNLLFDRYPDRNDAFYSGYLIRLTIDDSATEMTLVPFHQSDAIAGARKMAEADGCRFIDELCRQSELIRDPLFVAENWDRFCRQKRATCFSTLLGHGRLLRFLNREIPFAHRSYSRKSLLALHNLIRCESHRETLETVLKGLLGDMERRR